MDIKFTRHNVQPDTQILRVAIFKEDLDFPEKEKPKEIWDILEIPNEPGSPEVKTVMEIIKNNKKDGLKGQKEIFVFVEGI